VQIAHPLAIFFYAAQRITARYHLLPGAEDDTCAYIRHRMQVAGQKEQVFSNTAMRQVHRASRGIPRLINAICDRALLGAYAHDDHRVDAATVRRAAGEVLGRHITPRPVRLWRRTAVAAVAVAAGAAVVAGTWILLTHRDMRLMRGGVAPTRTSPPSVASSAPLVVPAPAARSAAPVPPDGEVSTVVPAESGPGVPVASARESKLVTSTRPSIGDLLSNPSLRADKKSAFVTLYARWNIGFDGATNSLACERGRPEGLRCLFKTGTWAKLRRFNLPAIIELSTAAGERRYATVIAADDQTATLDFGGQRHTFPLGEVDLYWDGPFILLWKGPVLTSPSIVPGARGKDVEWVRERLSEVGGGPVGGRDPDVFDDELRNRVIAFQRSRSLVPDGIVGEETLTHLSTTARDPSVPRLSRTGS